MKAANLQPVDDNERCGSDDLMDNVSVAEQNGLESVSTRSSRTSELTLSFEGEVYVFPAVTPDKVQFFCSIYVSFFFFVLLYICVHGMLLATVLHLVFIRKFCSLATKSLKEELMFLLDESLWLWFLSCAFVTKCTNKLLTDELMS